MGPKAQHAGGALRRCWDRLLGDWRRPSFQRKCYLRDKEKATRRTAAQAGTEKWCFCEWTGKTQTQEIYTIWEQRPTKRECRDKQWQKQATIPRGLLSGKGV